MNYAALGSTPSSKRDRVFFFLRDPSNLGKAVPAEFEHHFRSDSREDEARLDNLKERILRSGYEVSGMFQKSFTVVIYSCNDSAIVIYDHYDIGQYYKTIVICDPSQG
jgi:hypothetical protein